MTKNRILDQLSGCFESKPGVKGGRPCFRGTRIERESFIEYLDAFEQQTRRETVEDFWYLANRETNKYFLNTKFPALKIATFEVLNTVKDKLLDQLPDKQEV